MSAKRIIFIALAVVFVVVGFFSTDTSEQTNAISKAVYVKDGKVLAENEGKVVIVPGKAETVEPFIDKLTGVEIPHIKAYREVEIYKEAIKTDENGKTYYVLEWTPTVNAGENNYSKLVSSNLIAECKVGEFIVEPELIKSISAGKKLTDFSLDGPKSLGFFEGYYEGVTYISKCDILPVGGERKNGGMTSVIYKKYEGYERVNYKIPYEDNMEYTFVGRQKGNKIVYDKELKMQGAFSGLKTPEQLEKRVESGGMTGAIVAWAIAAFFLLLAFVIGKKKSQE